MSKLREGHIGRAPSTAEPQRLLWVSQSSGWACVQVMGASKVTIDGEAAALDVIARAAKARSTDATNMNATSSRSHSIFTLHITGRHADSGVELLGSLNLVDLAGSERLDRSGAEGQRQKETCAINKSLSSLGDIFQARSCHPSGHDWQITGAGPHVKLSPNS